MASLRTSTNDGSQAGADGFIGARAALLIRTPGRQSLSSGHVPAEEDTSDEAHSRQAGWRVSILRGRAQPLGVVEAPDERAAEAVAAGQFGLTGPTAIPGL
jgi:hypothetical protein